MVEASPVRSVDRGARHIRSAIDGGGVEAYVKSHIPGAVHSDYDKAGWRVTRNGVPFMLPTLPELEKLIGEAGIDEDSHVIVVPAGVSATDFGSAARVYWTFKVAGHPAVSILDGGFAAWQAAAYPIEAGKNPPSPKIFTAKLDLSLLAQVEAVERNAVVTDHLTSPSSGRPVSPEDFAGACAPCGAPCPSVGK